MLKDTQLFYMMPAFTIAKFEVGDKFVKHGRGYQPIWEVYKRHIDLAKGEVLYDLVSLRINTGAKLHKISQDTLLKQYRMV